MIARGKKATRDELPLKFFAAQYLKEIKDLHAVLRLWERVASSKGNDKADKVDLYKKLTKLDQKDRLHGELLTQLEEHGLAHPKAWLQRAKKECEQAPPKRRLGGR